MCLKYLLEKLDKRQFILYNINMPTRKVKSKSGRIYEYNYPREALILGRKPTEHHPDFKYKESFRPTSHDIEARMKCLSRDAFTCQICHKPSAFPTENYQDLNIHHKDNNGYGKTNRPDNSLENLVTLCDACHLQLHYDVLEKYKSIIALREEGFTLQSIGEKFGISRQRILQILKSEMTRNR